VDKNTKNTIQKIKSERKKHTQTIYIGSPHKSRVLPRDFTIISLDYNCSSTLAKDFSMPKFANKRLLLKLKSIRMIRIKHLIYYS
jgi:hypothetical protein